MVHSQNAPRRQAYLFRHKLPQLLPTQAAEALCLYHFSDGEYLCREETPLQYFHFLVDGRCRVTRFLQNGKESLICFYHNFAILGEIELICGLSSSINSVQALGPVWCLSLPIESAGPLLLNRSLSLQFLCSHLAKKLMRSDFNQSISLNYPVDQRLASYICYSCPGPEALFQTNYTHLAEYLGCSHRQLLRVLCHFRENGLLEKEGHGYRVLDSNSLKQLAGDIYSP